MSKVKMLVIKPWERTEHPTLKTKTELQKMKLMPKYNVKPRALVDRPTKYGGAYYLYDEILTMPYKKSQKQKEEEKKKRIKSRAAYTCASCKKYLGMKKVQDGIVRMWSHMCEECYFAQYRAYEKEKIICLDIETTGFDASSNEVLQLSIIDGTGKVLFNHYMKPKNITEWKEAEEVNGISPQMVQNERHLGFYKGELEKIFDNAELVVGYNSNRFDIPFLKQHDILISEKKTFDVMLKFAKIYGEWNEYRKDYEWQNLTKCVEYYGYKGNGSFHDSLEDVRATLFCFWEMIKSK